MFPPLRHILPQLAGRVPAARNFLIVHSGLLVCALFLLAGLFLVGDYDGIGLQVGTQRGIAQANLDYIRGLADTVDTPIYSDRGYGAAFELPLLLIEDALAAVNFPAAHRSRFILTHLFFIVSGWFCYRLAGRLFDNRLLALAVLLFFLLHPRIYAHSYFNSKDLPFVSMLMIALYLLERAFRRDTLGAFILLGIAVGLLTNLRIMGIMLLPAVLALRGLDWFYAGRGRERKTILLTAGLFVLTAGLTLYALTPYAWRDPVDSLLLSLTLAVGHPTVIPQLFMGQLAPAHELPQYNAVWFSITTPPPLLMLGGIGAAAIAIAGLRRPGGVLRNTRRRFMVLLLAAFLLPPAAAALLESHQYEGWRHFYFIFVPFCLLAGVGLQWLIAHRSRPPGRAVAYSLAGVGLALIALQMAQIHPAQSFYFNFLVDRTTPEYLRTQFYMPLVNARKAAALDYLRERHPGEIVAVREVLRSRLLDPTAGPGSWVEQDFAAADYALFHVRNDAHQDLAFNSLPVGRLYNNTFLAVKPLRADRMTAAALATYQQLYRQAVAGEPIIRAAYDVYIQDRTLTFVRENCPPGDRERQFFVKIFRPNPERSVDAAIALRSYGVRWADTCLAVIQLPAYAQGDLIVGQDQRGEYRWERLYSLARPGLGERIAAARLKNRQPVLRGDFDVFLEQDVDGQQRLLYAKPDCTEEDYQTLVTLHIYPAAEEDLPQLSRAYERREIDHENRDFYLRFYGGRPGGECMAQVPLPAYPIREIRTGQAGRWRGSLYPPDNPEPLRDAYAARAAVPPDRRDAFDLYWQEGQLTYIRESCAAADTAAPFLLHIIPRDAADLPAASQADGYANLDFGFGRWGGNFDGKCLATVPLPDYPIAAIRTGQAGLWEVIFYPPADPQYLRDAYAALTAIQPAARSAFALYIQDNRLIYSRETCAAADRAAGFFLHIVPEDPAALPADRRNAGFAHRDFDFARWGGPFDGQCLAAVPLPDYPIAAIRTGQEGIWEVDLYPPADPAWRRADYAALTGRQPAIREVFDLYLQDNRLLYLRETCAADDTAAGFFLHIIPEDVSDLPAAQQAAGFANRDFAFAQRGAHFDGKCLAAVPLPDYPIKEIRTGQYVPGQGEGWSAGLVTAP